MAKTVDEVIVKISTEGVNKLNQAGVAFEQLDKKATNTNAKMKASQLGLRNLGYQAQDVAVQLSMGTDAFIVMGQQLPQLVSSLGTLGVLLGAGLAIAIPVGRLALEAMGFDFRNLKERIDDLSKAQQQFAEAQKLGLPTAEAMLYQYGQLASEAERFNDVQLELSKALALNENIAVVEELKDAYKNLTDEITFSDRLLSAGTRGVATPERLAEMRINRLAKNMGITAEQAVEVGDKLRTIDSSSPKEAVEIITDLLNILKETNLQGKEYLDFSRDTLQPLQNLQRVYLALAENITASAEAQTALNAELLNAQNAVLPSINEARRNYNEISAIQQEAAFKIAQYEENLRKESLKDQVDRTEELAAFRLRVEQDLADKIADIQQKQEETTRSIQLGTDSKERQLELESAILDLNTQGLRSSLNVLQYEQEILKNQNERVDAVIKLEEQLRKNVITQEQFNILKQEALDLEQKANELAQQGLQIRAQQFVAAQERIVESEKERLAFLQRTLTLSDRERRNREQIFKIEQERAKELKALENLTDLTKRAELERQINEAYDERIDIAQQAQEQDQANRENFEAGWQRALNNYVDDSRNAFKKAEELFNQTTRGMEDAIVKFARTGKFEWRNLVADMLETLLRSQIQQVIAKTFSMGQSSGGGLGSLFAGFFANGGFIPAGQVGIVGERGPELIGGPAQITPMGGSVTYNINAVDARSFKQLVAEDPQFIHAVASQGSRAVPVRR